MTMQQFADEYAQAIKDAFHEPVDVVGVSTGGSIAARPAGLAPSAATTRTLSHDTSTPVSAGALSAAEQVHLPRPWRGRALVAAIGWLAANRLVPQATGWDDLVATISAEDVFDLAACPSPVRAPTLIIAGRVDRFYTPALFEETAALIPDSELHMLERRGHIAVLRDRRSIATLVRFLT